MPTKIRLQRFGKKGQPFYRIVVADSRAPRDGRFIENIGTYNPLTIPATIQLDADRALYWLQVGAQPTDTARAILSYKGILYKHHLQKGVIKGALSQEDADAKFNAWVEEKEQKIVQKIKDKELAQKELMKKKVQDESKIREEIAKAVAEKRAKAAAAKVSPDEEETESAEEAQETEVQPEEAPAQEAIADEVISEGTTEAEVQPEETPEQDTVAEEAITEEAPEAEAPVNEEAPDEQDTTESESEEEKTE